jgi:prepilin-type N-terminal cleavage/methylation domain-containing protein
MRPPKYNSQGFTLIEMLATIVLAGIIMGFALPSFLSLNKPLRDGSLEFKAQLSLIRSKAIAGNRAYRLKPKYLTAADVSAAHPNRSYPQAANNFIVEYAANCQVTAIGGTNGWQSASQFALDLPDAIGVASTPLPQVSGANATSFLNWSICYDNRGIAYKPVSLTLKDFQGNNRAVSALISIVGIGSVDITTKDKNDTQTGSIDNPVF